MKELSSIIASAHFDQMLDTEPLGQNYKLISYLFGILRGER